MNQVKLVGNVGQDLNLMTFEKSKKASFTLATTESYNDKNNEPVKNTTWHNVVAWGKAAEACENIIKKGKLVSVEGKITNRQYTNSNQQTVTVTEINIYKVEEHTYNKK